MKTPNESHIDAATLFEILIAGALRCDEALMEANEGKQQEMEVYNVFWKALASKRRNSRLIKIIS